MRLFALMLALLCFFSLSAQMGWSAEVTPNIVFSKYKVNGLIPGGLIFHKVNPSLSAGGSVFYRTDKGFTFRVGLHYFFNNHRESYYRDSDSEKVKTMESNVRTTYFEPRLSIKYDIPFKNIHGVFIELGLGYYKPGPSMGYASNFNVSLGDSPDIHSEKNSVKVQSIGPGIEAVKTAPWKAYFAVGKTYHLTKEEHRRKASLDVMLIYRYSGDEIRISNAITDSQSGMYYEYSHIYASPYVGITVRFNSFLTNRTKPTPSEV